MRQKELLIELCEKLEKELNEREGEQSHKVELQSGLKPENYFTPAMHIGTTSSIPDRVRMAWFVELWVDGECIFRETYVLPENVFEDLTVNTEKIIEDFLISKVLNRIFAFGVMTSKSFIDKLVHG